MNVRRLFSQFPHVQQAASHVTQRDQQRAGHPFQMGHLDLFHVFGQAVAQEETGQRSARYEELIIFAFDQHAIAVDQFRQDAGAFAVGHRHQEVAVCK